MISLFPHFRLMAPQRARQVIAALLWMVVGSWGGTMVTAEEETAAKSANRVADTSWADRPVVVKLRDSDLTGNRVLRDLERLLQKVESDQASHLVLDLDISQSSDWDSQRRVLDLLSELTLPISAFVHPNATGDGVLVALSAQQIYMSPNSIIGGGGLASPPTSGDEKPSDADRARRAQQLSILKARARSVAVGQGHDPALAEALVDEQREYRRGEELISPAGEGLTLTAAEATRVVEGKPLLGKAVVPSVEALLEAAGMSGEPVVLSPRQFNEEANRSRLVTGRGGEAEEEGSEAALIEGVEEAPPPSVFRKQETASYQGKIVVIPVKQDTLATGKASFDFMERTIKKAEVDKATAIIFDMDTPGGIAWYTDGLVLNSLPNLTVPTYSFVNPRAESAGAIIAVGTDHIYMRPAATIGSALVVAGTGQDLSASMEDKVTQMIIGSVRNMAELKGHNPDLAEAFVTRDKEVRVGGQIIHEAGNVLNLNTIRATEIIDGRPVLAKGVANDIAHLVALEQLSGEVVEAKPLGLEAFAHWIQKISIVLIVIGLAGAYMEMNTPGFGLPGFVSVSAFTLFFFGNYLAGNLAGYEMAVLLVIGLLLIVVEILIFPGAIIPGLMGGLLVIGTLVLSMVDRVDFQWKWDGLPGASSWLSLIQGAFFSTSLGLVGAVAAILLAMRFVPQTKLGQKLILTQAISSGAALPADSLGQDSSRASLLGRSGVTVTNLVPSGRAVFEGQFVDVLSQGEYIGKGDPVRVLRHEGSLVVVEKIEKVTEA